MPVSETKKEVSILIPAYNEALQIEKCVRAVNDAVSAFSNSYEIIVTEDGSTDETSSIVSKLMKTMPNLRFLHMPIRLGKGKAIKRGLGSAQGEIILFMDVDLATNLDYLPKFLELIKTNGGLAIGSRYAQGAIVKRHFSRTMASLVYNIFVRALFLDGIKDHQCGFKAMSSDVARASESVKADGFFFDTEMILRCKKLGFPVMEVGVEWAENPRLSESKVRVFNDAQKIGKDMLLFRLNDYKHLKNNFKSKKNVNF